MPLIFHQNMRTYHGGVNDRYSEFLAAFVNIRGEAGMNFIAAGFTEVMSDKPGVTDNLPDLARALDPDLTEFTLVGVGVTAHGCREFIGIFTNPKLFTASSVGHVLYDDMVGRQVAFDTEMADVEDGKVPVPDKFDNLQADNRGVAYVTGHLGPKPYVVGFMHNMYQIGNRYRGFGAMGKSVGVIQKAAPDFADATVIIGGDFNTPPHNPARRTPLYARYQKDLHGEPVATTMGGHTYDFFLVSDETIADGRARVWPHTQQMFSVPHLSDHCGISLEI